MTARVLTGSKQEIAQQLASLAGDVRKAIVFIDEPSQRATVAPAAPETVDDMFKQMEPPMVNVGGADYSREGIYARKPGE